MITELSMEHFSRITHLVPSNNQYVPVLSVLAGTFPGRIFVDDPDQPSRALVWAVSRWSYLIGISPDEQFTQDLTDLLRSVIIPDAKLLGMSWFEMYVPDSDTWKGAVSSAIASFPHADHHEMIFSLNQQLFQEVRRDVTLGEATKLIRQDTPILEETLPQVPWIHSDFTRKTTFGFMVLNGKGPMTLCRSNGFIAGNKFMVDVETFDNNDRGKGYATAAGNALMDYCVTEQLQPYWETNDSNVASVRLAERLGFVKEEQYPVYSVLFDETAQQH